jgi:hypothetical protein
MGKRSVLPSSWGYGPVTGVTLSLEMGDLWGIRTRYKKGPTRYINDNGPATKASRAADITDRRRRCGGRGRGGGKPTHSTESARNL